MRHLRHWGNGRDGTHAQGAVPKPPGIHQHRECGSKGLIQLDLYGSIRARGGRTDSASRLAFRHVGRPSSPLARPTARWWAIFLRVRTYMIFLEDYIFSSRTKENGHRLNAITEHNSDSRAATGRKFGQNCTPKLRFSSECSFLTCQSSEQDAIVLDGRNSSTEKFKHRERSDQCMQQIALPGFDELAPQQSEFY